MGIGMREKLIELLMDAMPPNYSDVFASQIADHLIANGVTIPVRCKDCKHFTKGMAIGMCKRIADKPILPMRYDDFCSYGERKTNA